MIDSAGRTQLKWFLTIIGGIDLAEKSAYQFRDDTERREAAALAMESLRNFEGVINVRAPRDQHTAEISVELSRWLKKSLASGLQ